MKEKTSFVIKALIVFLVFLYTRPYELLPFLIPLRLTRVSMVIALLASFSGKIKKGFIWRESSFKYMTLLQVITIVLIPLGFWSAQSFGFWTSSYLKTYIGFYIILVAVTNYRNFDILLKAVLFCCGFVGLRVMYGLASGNYIFVKGVKRVMGVSTLTSNDPNDLALVLAMAVPIGLYYVITNKAIVKKAFYAAITFTLILAVLYTGSRGGYLGLLFAGLFFFGSLYKKQKAKFIGMIILLSIVILAALPAEHKARFASMFDKTDYSYEDKRYGRIAIWKRGIASMKRIPLGTGIKNYSLAEGEQKTERGVTGKWMVAHNSYLQVGVELGWVGLIVYMLFLLSGFKNLILINKAATIIKDKKVMVCSSAFTGALAAFMVSSFFLSQAYYWNQYIFIAMIAALKRLVVNNPVYVAHLQKLKSERAKKEKDKNVWRR